MPGLRALVCAPGSVEMGEAQGRSMWGGGVGEQEIQSFGHTKLEMSVIHTVLIM